MISGLLPYDNHSLDIRVYYAKSGLKLNEIFFVVLNNANLEIFALRMRILNKVPRHTSS